MTKRIYSLILLALVCLPQLMAKGNLERSEQIRQKLLSGDEKYVFVASHRGDWRNYAENSLEGILSAIRMGVDIVEVDLQRTKDGVLILQHDATIDRCTTGKGKISEMTWDEIKKYRLKNGVSIHTPFQIPTLEEVLIATKGKALLNLDKADRYFEEVYALLQKTGTTRQIVMKGTKSAQAVKDEFGKYLNDVIYMPIVSLDDKNAEEEIEKFIQDMHPVAFELLYQKDSNPLPHKLAGSLKGRTLIWYNTLWDTMAGGHDDTESLSDLRNGWGYLVDQLHCRMIQTDRPQMLIQYLKKRKLRKL